MSSFYDLSKTPRNILNQAIVRAIVSGNNGAWFDPEDMSTMFQDAAGTTPVTALEQPVGRWLDKSGNGNHAAQPITASRPTLSARYNLLTRTEDFADVVWVKNNSSVINIQSPDGSITAGRITNNSGATNSSYVRFATSKSAGITYSHIVKVRKGTSDFIFIRDLYAADTPAYFNLNTGLFETTGSGLTAFVKSFIDGWYELVIVSSVSIGNNLLDFGPASANNNNRLSNPGDYVDIWHPQLNIGTTPLPYQRVNTAMDYDSVGWPKYLKFNGIDDYLNLPYMGLYANGSASVVVSASLASQESYAFMFAEANTTTNNTRYSIGAQLPSGGSLAAIIRRNDGVDISPAASSGILANARPQIRSMVDSGSSVRFVLQGGQIDQTSTYTRSGVLTPTTTTIGCAVATANTGYCAMNTYGLIITKSALSDIDRRRCEQFLTRRLTSLGVTLS